MNFEEISVLLHSSCFLCLRGFFLSLHQACLHCWGTGSQAGSIGMVAPPGNQLSTGSGAFISALKLWMDLIFHDELPQPNEREREMRGSRKSRKPRKRTQEEFFCLHSLGRSACWRSYVRFSGKYSSSLLTHASLSNQMKSQRRSSFSPSWCALEQHTSS